MKEVRLIALEENKNIPFEVKRVYFMYNTKKEVHRGFHAHKKITASFVLSMWLMYN